MAAPWGYHGYLMVIRRRLGWTAKIAPRPTVAVLLAVCFVASGCSSDQGLSAGDAATVAEGSRATFAVEDGEWTEAEAGATVPDGAEVRPVGGELRLEFRTGSVRLSPDAAAVVTAERVTVDRGEALVASNGALSGTVDDTTVAGQAQYRLTSGLAARVGVYEGAVTVRRPAQERAVPALRELDLSAFRLGSEEPLQYREDDAWDRDLLGAAIAFDGEAARLTRGLDVELGRRPLKARFYRQFTQPTVLSILTNHAPTARRGAFGPPSDLMLTLFVAEAAAGDAVKPAVREVVDLREAGARWGLIAVELEVSSEKVVAAIDGLDDKQIAAADNAAAFRPAPVRRPGAGAEVDVGTRDTQVAGTSSVTGSTQTTSGTDSSGDDGQPKEGNQTPDDGGNDQGDDGGNDPVAEPPKEPSDDPSEGPSEEPDDEDPTLEEAVTKVVEDVVNGEPDVPGSVDAVRRSLPEPEDLLEP